MPPAYLAHRGEVALAVAGAAEVVLGRRWPLADLNRAAIHQVTLDLSAPGTASNLYVLLEGAPFAYERMVTAFDFLVDADHYAEGNNPNAVANCWPRPRPSPRRPLTAYRTHQPHPWSPR